MTTLGDKDLAPVQNFQGVRTGLIEISHPPEAEAEGKPRWHVRSKTQLHALSG